MILLHVHVGLIVRQCILFIEAGTERGNSDDLANEI